MTSFTVVSRNADTGAVKRTTVSSVVTIEGAINLVAGTIYSTLRFSGWAVDVLATHAANSDDK